MRRQAGERRALAAQRFQRDTAEPHVAVETNERSTLETALSETTRSARRKDQRGEALLGPSVGPQEGNEGQKVTKRRRRRRTTPGPGTMRPRVAGTSRIIGDASRGISRTVPLVLRITCVLALLVHAADVDADVPVSAKRP